MKDDNNNIADRIILRRAKDSDISSLTELEKICFSDPWSETSVKAQLDGRCCLSVAAESDGVTAGYIFMQCIPPECEIYRVAVRPDLRRSGIGEKILRYAVSVSVAIGCTDFFLEVRKSNTAAVNLYAKAGFASVAERRNYYKNPVEDAVIMSMKP